MPLRGRAVPQNLSILFPIHDLPRDLFAVVVGVAEHDLGRFGAFVYIVTLEKPAHHSRLRRNILCNLRHVVNYVAQSGGIKN